MVVDRKSRTSSPANGYDSLDKCSSSIQVPPTPDSYQMNLGNMIDSRFSSPMNTSPEKLSAESAQPAATTTSGPVLDSASALHGSGDELNNGPPLTQSSIDTNGCQFSVTVPDELANSLKPAAYLKEEVADEELSSSVSPDEPMSHGDLEIVYDKMAGQRLSPLDVADIPLPPAKKPRFSDSGEMIDMSFNVPTIPVSQRPNIPLSVHKNLTDMNRVLKNIPISNGSSTNKLPLPDLGQMKLPAFMPFSFFNPVPFNQRQDIAAPRSVSVLNGINLALSQLPHHVVPIQHLGHTHLPSTLKIVPNNSNDIATDGGTTIFDNANKALTDMNNVLKDIPISYGTSTNKPPLPDLGQMKLALSQQSQHLVPIQNLGLINLEAASTTKEPEIITIED